MLAGYFSALDFSCFCSLASSSQQSPGGQRGQGEGRMLVPAPRTCQAPAGSGSAEGRGSRRCGVTGPGGLGLRGAGEAKRDLTNSGCGGRRAGQERREDGEDVCLWERPNLRCSLTPPVKW